MAKPVLWLVPAVWAGGLFPPALIAVDFARGQLGANPVSAALNQLGLLSLVALTSTLACTPLTWLGWSWPARIRRALGLLTFTYVSLHLATYVGLDLGLAFAVLGDDLVKRPFITVGFLAWLLLVPLALTSTDRAVRRLGYVTWKRVHRLTYFCAGLGVLHFVWRTKKDTTEALAYGSVIAGLLLARVLHAVAKKRRRRRDPRALA